jgi:hypothetical protein
MSAYAKGRREEEELVRMLRKAGFQAERVPISGAMRADKADILCEDLLISVKYGASCPKSLYTASAFWAGDILVVPLLPWIEGCIQRCERLPKYPEAPTSITREVGYKKILIGRTKRSEWKLAGYYGDLLCFRVKGGGNDTSTESA